MEQQLTLRELADSFGVTPRTVKRWVKQGCPCSRDRGRLLFDQEEVRQWRQGHGPGWQGGPGAAPGFSASRESLAKAELARKLTQAKKNELELSAERALKDLKLGDKIRAAKSHDDLANLSQEVGALVGSGSLSTARSHAIRGLLAEARHNMKEHRSAEGEEEPERLLLATEEGAEMLRVFEGICSDERRTQVMAYLLAEAEVDLQEYPDVDTAAALEEEEGE